MASQTQTIPQKIKRRFRNTGTRRTVIGLLADFFCLRIKDAAVLMNADPASRADCRNIQDIFSRLRDQGIVSRLPYFDLEMDRPTRSYVYGLTDKGVREFGGKTFDEHSERTLDHELAITRFHIALSEKFKAPRFRVRWNQGNINHTVKPDAYFSITDYELPPEKNTAHYFLEIERAKIGSLKNGEPSIIRKLAHYYEYYDTDECEKEWGFRRFRIITVVRNADKQYNLCDRLHQKPVHRPSCPVAKGLPAKNCRCTPISLSHRMFWITTTPHVREDIAGGIFKTPRDFQKMAYSFISH